MPVHWRKHKRLLGGMVTVNASERGITSYTIHPLPRTSYNTRTKKWTVDLPGPFKWTSK